MAVPTRDELFERFLDALPFEPYPFQEEALLRWFESEEGLLVTAPTGMGKTVIAEAALFEALATRRRVYYTTPLIALTDQKFREFCGKAEAWGFSAEDVGLLTGNRKVRPEAPVVVVVAEILLNHLLDRGRDFSGVDAVVMDEFHWFNERERGIVWELALVLLPKRVRTLLLSATVGNPAEFLKWLREEHGRSLHLVQSGERRVPLEFHWVEDRYLPELLEGMHRAEGDERKTPALVFAFVRDACWDLAERLKGLRLLDPESRRRIEEILAEEDFEKGAGPKLRQFLLRGVGIHHAGILPRYKEVVERLFLERLVPFVLCTETLAAGINLPARSVVLTSLLKGKPGERKLIAPSSAHQIFGRAGRPQFDDRGHVFAVAHEDDVRIAKWKEKVQKLEATGSKDPGVLKALKQLERKRPRRRSHEQYWTRGQFESLQRAGPADLRAADMIPYRVLVYLLVHRESVQEVRAFLASRLDDRKRREAYQRRLDVMLKNLAALGWIRLGEGDDEVEVAPEAADLLEFRSVEPLFGAWLAKTLAPSSFDEKVMALESLLDTAPAVARAGAVPWDMDKGPLQKNVLEPLLVSLGMRVPPDDPHAAAEREEQERGEWNPWREEEERPPTFPEMLAIAFERELAEPEETRVQPKWIAGGVFDSKDDFHSFVASRRLQRNEGIVFRHLLRLAILAAEFHGRTEDPDYEDLSRRVTEICRRVDARTTERTLERVEEERAALRG